MDSKVERPFEDNSVTEIREYYESAVTIVDLANKLVKGLTDELTIRIEEDIDTVLEEIVADSKTSGSPRAEKFEKQLRAIRDKIKQVEAQKNARNN